MSGEVLFIQVEPTTRCNFSCRFCAGRHLPQRDMGPDVFETILRSFPRVRHIELQGEGEPLVCPGFFDMVQLTRKLCPAARVSTITNGSLFSAENIRRILDLGLYALSVSIESADPETFHKLRGGCLEKVVEGTRALMAAKRSRATVHPVVGFAVTLLRQTRTEMPRLIALYDSLGLDGGLVSQQLQTMQAYARHYDAATMAEVLSPGDVEAVWRAVAQDPRAVAVLRRPVAAVGFYAELFAGWEPGSGTCPWLSRGLYVTADGCATSCCFQKDTAINRFGVIGQASIDELTENRRKLADGLRQGKPAAGCRDCGLARQVMASFVPIQTDGAGSATRELESDGSVRSNRGSRGDREVQPKPESPPPPRPASLAAAAASLIASMARFAASGFKTVDEALHELRMGHCKPCEYRRENQCSLCRCFIAKKAWLPHEDCPIGRWES